MPPHDTEVSGCDGTITLDGLARELDVPVRVASVSARRRWLSRCLRTELAGRIGDVAWREDVCAALAEEPLAVRDLVDAVRALRDDEVLDLFGPLRDLGSNLPGAVRVLLLRVAGMPGSARGMAALRLGLEPTMLHRIRDARGRA